MTADRLANIQVSVGIGSILVGLLLIVGPGSSLFAAYEQSIASAIGGDQGIYAGNPKLTHWLLATCGAGVVGWGIAWTVISHIPLRQAERWSYLCLSTSLAVWAVLDLLIALWFQVSGEILFVLCAFALAAAPLFLARRSFGVRSEVRRL